MSSEIEKLAVELAEWVKKTDKYYGESARIIADRILGRTRPEEPLPWPGVKGTPIVWNATETRWFVSHGGWQSPCRDTRAEAIAEWNKVVKAMQGNAHDKEAQP